MNFKNEDQRQRLIKYLSYCMTEERFDIFKNVLENRTRYITVVLEDIFQSQNASAVLRTCDCFGIQDVHIIENNYEYNINPDVALGSYQWLNLYKYNSQPENTISAIKSLREKGYRIVATTPHKNDVLLNDFDINKGKLALLFGAELPGLSDIALNEADEYLKIPLFGFTESFNISVSAAIILNVLTDKLRSSNIIWQIESVEKSEIMIEWLKESVKSSDLIIKRFFNEENKQDTN